MDYSGMNRKELEDRLKELEERQREAQRKINEEAETDLLREQVKKEEERTVYYEEAAKSRKSEEWEDPAPDYAERPSPTTSIPRTSFDPIGFMWFLCSSFWKNIRHENMQALFAATIVSVCLGIPAYIVGACVMSYRYFFHPPGSITMPFNEIDGHAGYMWLVTSVLLLPFVYWFTLWDAKEEIKRRAR